LFTCTQTGTGALETEEKKVLVFRELMKYTEIRKAEAPVAISRTAVQRIKNFLTEQYTEQLTLTELAEYADLSPYHLVRSFKQTVGLTPFQFLRNYRIEKSKQELLSNKPIAAVAVEVGFYDQSHFHKHFKLVTGFTPREFQRH
jgi:AraC-like DNA-binding protein